MSWEERSEARLLLLGVKTKTEQQSDIEVVAISSIVQVEILECENKCAR